MCEYPLVSICLSTYNGEKYLPYQLESLIAQDYHNFTVYVRDDGSTDSTKEIIERYCEMAPDIFSHVDNDCGTNLGITDSFLLITAKVPSSSYLMFCDQDDVWFPEKTRLFVEEILNSERVNMSSHPLLVFGDMKVTDSELNIICDSFWDYQKIETEKTDDWRRVLASNMVTGCSMIMNPCATILLKEELSKINLLHDHLAAVLVSRYGTLLKLAKPTMYYRQHSSNNQGAGAFGTCYLLLNSMSFILKVLPRYIEACNELGVPVFTLLYLKLESTIRRLNK